jgi:hypothetical protein
MKSHRIVSALILWLFVILGFAQQPNRSLTVPEYIAELDRLSASVNNSQPDPKTFLEAVKRMPQIWNVRAENRTFQVRSEWLRQDVAALFEKNPNEARRLLQLRIAVFQTDAQAFQQPKNDRSLSSKALADILARREFRSVHGRTWFETWQEMFWRWLEDMTRLIVGNSTFPTISKIMVWALVFTAVTASAFWIFKIIRRNAELAQISLRARPVSAKPWNDWMAEANAAAARDAWRDAIHLAYWTGISFLESQGLWRPDAARTPREYLHLINPSSEYRDSLSGLTMQFESVWYGFACAGRESFVDALKHLENMGCRAG